MSTYPLLRLLFVAAVCDFLFVFYLILLILLIIVFYIVQQSFILDIVYIAHCNLYFFVFKTSSPHFVCLPLNTQPNNSRVAHKILVQAPGANPSARPSLYSISDFCPTFEEMLLVLSVQRKSRMF